MNFFQPIAMRNISTEIASLDNYDNEDLNCGKTVNYTHYDELIGIAQRYNHPIVPEPEVRNHALIEYFLVEILKKSYLNRSLINF